ncbi:MAG: metallophosphoesterase family protein [Candidatus Acetothermia bacterium]|nr:metallophosphoesterase family protein [Candidatus Acetothermia bacterium]
MHTSALRKGMAVRGAGVLLLAVALWATGQPWPALGPWVAAVGPTEAVVSWQAAEPGMGTVWYAEASAYPAGALSVAVEAPTALQHVRLSGLAPGVRYVYRVVLPSGAESPVASFTTPPERFQPFTFLVYGDSRTHYDRHQLVAERMAAEEAAFVVHVGDLVESPTPLEWEKFFTSGTPLFQATSFYPVLGNHERNHASYYDLFPLPAGGGRAGKQWWSLRWGDVLLVGLDSNLVYLKFTGLREQTDWLREVLAQDARYKFVFLHHPLYSSDLFYRSDENLAKLWAPIFREHGVTAVFAGHCHNYEHVVREGVHYFVTGGGGAPLAPLSPIRVEGSVFAADFVLHYVRVEVGEAGVTVKMIPVAREQKTETGTELVLLSGVPLEVVELGGDGG